MKVRQFVWVALATMLATAALSPRMAPAWAAEDPFTALRVRAVNPPAPTPEVAIPKANGGTLTLSELRGNVVVVGFFVTS